ncbi:hypothetical protein, partial [Enterobacter hormaechei]|uniref:hypothetical protein n=1 Tax=Enterobacter hormaechei TaxID=158836 RepID=UPI00197AD8AD
WLRKVTTVFIVGAFAPLAVNRLLRYHPSALLNATFTASSYWLRKVTTVFIVGAFAPLAVNRLLRYHPSALLNA